jgi:ABC-type glycerol-3-phosphate transport system permease component
MAKSAERADRGVKRRGTAFAIHAVLIACVVFTLFPLVLMVSAAFRTSQDVRTDPFALFTSFSLDNLIQAWTAGDFANHVRDSLLLSLPATGIVLVCSVLGGYTFARLPFRGRTMLFYIIMLGLMVPSFTYMIPMYFQLKDMMLLDTLPGAVLVLATGQIAFGVYFMRAFFSELPLELEQAARVDGCSEWKIFFRVMLPLGGAGAGALTVFTFLQTWNNFLIPLMFLPSGRFRPVTAGLYSLMGGRSTDIGPVAAGALITITPVLIVFLTLQRQVTQGFIAGAVKG